MSYNPYQPLSPEIQAEIRRQVKSGIAASSLTTVWFNPEEERYYSALDPSSQEPQYDIPLTKPKKFRGLGASRARRNTVQSQLQGGSSSMSSTEVDTMRFQPFTDETVDDALNFYDGFDKARKEYEQTHDMAKFLGAGTITTSSYPGVANVLVDQTVLELITREFVILDAVTRKPWSKLVYTYDNMTPFQNTGGLGELDSGPSGNVSLARGSITLVKAQGRVSVSIWAGLAVRDHDVVAMNENIVSADFERIFANNVATTIATFTNNATAGAYDVIAGGAFHSTTSPHVRFIADSGTIRTNGGRADIALMNTQDFNSLGQNTYMRDGMSVLGRVTTPAGRTESRVTTHPLWPGVQIYIDEVATTDQISLYDKRGVIFLEGPTATRTVMTNDDQVRDTVNDRWYNSGVKVAGWGRDATNITT